VPGNFTETLQAVETGRGRVQIRLTSPPRDFFKRELASFELIRGNLAEAGEAFGKIFQVKIGDNISLFRRAPIAGEVAAES